ncbi:odorant receptor 13a-like [Microplitis demolitor]|uniref:odorant receptor 13a-like n=1 Tax=Microplitis demolitor TaxID=69319 RepID=UPI00235B6CA8|nr:odorant receptor 13a-like [Microplitis demolitor]
MTSGALHIDNYVMINRKILKLVGLYPVDLRRYFFSICCLLLIIIPEVLRIFFNQKDLDVILETSSVLSTILLAVIKSTIWIIFRRQDTTILINFLFNDYWDIVVTYCSANEIKYIDKNAKIAKRITVSYIVLIVNALLIFYSLPLRHYIIKGVAILKSDVQDPKFNVSLNFPFIAAYPQFCYKSPFYEVVYFSQMLATSMCGLIILAMDTLIATAIFHSCGHFNVLCSKLQHINFQNNYHLTDELITIIKHHQLAIRFSDHLEYAFNPLMLFQVIASSIIICLVGFQVNTTLKHDNKDKLVEYICYLMMALFQLLLFCWPGDKLINDSLRTNEAAYSTNWYSHHFSHTIKTELILMILRSQRPSYLSAGKFHLMSLENFSTILSTSVSYFMLLQNLDM